MRAELVEQSDFLHDKSIRTIYFGGGTPSSLSIKQLKKWLLDIIKYGLENVENLVRYPAVQRHIIDMDREHLKVVRHINSYVSNNLENGDYVLTEILGEYFDTYEGWRGTITRYPAAGEIYSAVAKYISTHDDIPEEVNRNIFNIITNSRAYSRMFSELDRNMTMEDIENIEEVKGDFFDKIITGENKDSSFGVKEAYLLKYYNISLVFEDGTILECSRECLDLFDDSEYDAVLYSRNSSIGNVYFNSRNCKFERSIENLIIPGEFLEIKYYNENSDEITINTSNYNTYLYVPKGTKLILNTPNSLVFLTCGPPHNSLEISPIE